MIRIALVDDHTMVRHLMRDVMSTNEDMETVADFDSGEALLAALDGLEADLIILDISLGGMDGIETIAALRAAGCATPVLCLTMHLNRSVMQRAFKAGANGYAVKHDPFNVLTAGIRTVARGERFISPALDEAAAPPTGTQEILALLSPREREILTLVASGWTAVEIADHLSISERTVDFHRRKIGEKTGLKRIPDIVKFAIGAGIPTDQ